jgi:hypothetical protein
MVNQSTATDDKLAKGTLPTNERSELSDRMDNRSPLAISYADIQGRRSQIALESPTGIKMTNQKGLAKQSVTGAPAMANLSKRRPHFLLTRYRVPFRRNIMTQEWTIERLSICLP